MSELVYCIKRSAFEKETLISDEDAAFLPRKTPAKEDDVEFSREWIQLIPYITVVLNSGKEKLDDATETKVIAYRRCGNMAGEDRLTGTWSFGFGGHMNPCDFSFRSKFHNEEPSSQKMSEITLLENAIYMNVVRELYEELQLDPSLYNGQIYYESFLRYKNCNASEPTVNDVHAMLPVTVFIDKTSDAYVNDKIFKETLMKKLSQGTMATVPITDTTEIEDAIAGIKQSLINNTDPEKTTIDDEIVLEPWSQEIIRETQQVGEDDGDTVLNKDSYLNKRLGELYGDSSEVYPISKVYEHGLKIINGLIDVRSTPVNKSIRVMPTFSIKHRYFLKEIPWIRQGTFIIDLKETNADETDAYVGYLAIKHRIKVKPDGCNEEKALYLKGFVKQRYTRKT